VVGKAFEVSDGVCTRCGHKRLDHHKPSKRRPVGCEPFEELVRGYPMRSQCPCTGYTVAVLPQGERLEFGKHRLPQDEAETAEGWPPL
jgi:hypothetical protein